MTEPLVVGRPLVVVHAEELEAVRRCLELLRSDVPAGALEVIVSSSSPLDGLGDPGVERFAGAEPGAAWRDFAAIIRSGRLAGHSIVLRHVDTTATDTERLVALLAGRSPVELATALRRDLDGGAVVPDDRSLTTALMRGSVAAAFADLDDTADDDARRARIAEAGLELRPRDGLELGIAPSGASRIRRAESWATCAAVPSDREAAAARAHGVTGFLVRRRWDARGLAPSTQHDDGVSSGTGIPTGVILEHSIVDEPAPEGNRPIRTPWVDPGPQHYAALAAQVAELAAGPAALRFDGAPVVVIQDAGVLDDAPALVAALRTAVTAASGRPPWIAAVGVAYAPNADRPGVPPGFDGSLLLPLDHLNRAMTTRKRSGGPHPEARVIDLAARRAVDDLTALAIDDDALVPGALLAWDTTRRLGDQGFVGVNWSIARFRAALEASVRAVSARSAAERVVVIEGWDEPGVDRALVLATVDDVIFLQ